MSTATRTKRKNDADEPAPPPASAPAAEAPAADAPAAAEAPPPPADPAPPVTPEAPAAAEPPPAPAGWQPRPDYEFRVGQDGDGGVLTITLQVQRAAADLADGYATAEQAVLPLLEGHAAALLAGCEAYQHFRGAAAQAEAAAGVVAALTRDREALDARRQLLTMRHMQMHGRPALTAEEEDEFSELPRRLKERDGRLAGARAALKDLEAQRAAARAAAVAPVEAAISAAGHEGFVALKPAGAEIVGRLAAKAAAELDTLVDLARRRAAAVGAGGLRDRLQAWLLAVGDGTPAPPA